MANQKTSKVLFTHITIGLELAMTVLIFVYGGYRLDEHYGKSPLFVTIGAVIGMVLGFYHLIKQLNTETRHEKEEKENPKKRVRWM